MTARSRSSKILLVSDRRADSGPAVDATVLRRYRLARLQVDPRPAGGQARYDHPKRPYV